MGCHHTLPSLATLIPLMDMETPKFKANVRKRKALGLTRSLKTGYRPTDLGEQVAAALVIRS